MAVETRNVLSWEKIDCLNNDGPIPALKNHTATLVGNKLFIFGGYDENKNHNTMHVLDCITYQWTTLRNVGLFLDQETNKLIKPSGRNGHSATLVGSQIYILGGWNGKETMASSELWVFDTKVLSWTRVETYGSSFPCNMHTCEYIEEKHQLVVFRGGDGKSFFNDVHILDLHTHEWRTVNPTGKSPMRRANHASAVIGSMIYIYGGWDGQKRLNDLHVLNLRTEPPEWFSPSDVGEKPSARAGMRLVAVNEKLYLFGGSTQATSCVNDLYVFDTSTNVGKWMKPKVLLQNEGSGGGGTVADGEEANQRVKQAAAKQAREVAAQNFPDGNPNEGPPSAKYMVMGNPPSPRTSHSATRIGRKIIIFGGSRRTTSIPEYCNDFYVLDTDVPPDAADDTTTDCTEVKQGANLGSYFENNQFTDVVFSVEGKLIRSHRLVLSLRSERFRAMFSSKFLEKKKAKIKITDMSYKAFGVMIKFLYTGTLPAFPVIAETPENQNETETIFEEQIEEDVGEMNIFDFGGSKGSFDSEEYESVAMESISMLSSTKENSRILRGTAKLIEMQTNVKGKFEEEQHGELLDLFAELMFASDRYILPQLKRSCEQILREQVRMETVGIIQEIAAAANAHTLKSFCEHFSTNYEEIMKTLV